MKKLLYKLLKLLGFFKNNKMSRENSTTSVVITGVENSPRWGPCAGSTKDCDMFKNIIEISADDYDITVLKNEKATVDAWKAAVKEAVKKPLAIIFYSGHGGTDKNHVLGKGKNEEDGIDEFLCLYDKPLLDDDIWNIISKSEGRVFLIFDCCHSGTMFRTASISLDEKYSQDFEVFDNIDLNKFATTRGVDLIAPSILCWSACADNTVAKGSSSGGLFTKALNNFYSPGESYKSIWKKLEKDKSLKNNEVIQISEIGQSFQSQLFCR
jgi:hypothetical protein